MNGTLYHSIDGTSCMIALISPSYLKSSVCMEEYSLAQTKHLSRDTLHLIPICISDGIESDFAHVSHLPMLDARADAYDKAVGSICSAVVSWLEMGSFAHLDKILQKKQDNHVDVPELMEMLRVARFWNEYRSALRATKTENKTFPPNLDKVTYAVEKVKGEGGDNDEGKEETGKEEEEKKEGNSGKNSASGEVEEEEKKDESKEEKADTVGGDSNKENEEIQKNEEEKKELEQKEPNNEDNQQSALNLGGAEKLPSKFSHSDAESTPKREKTSKVPTIVFSYHQNDIKFVHFLKELLQTFAPHVAIKWEFNTDQERLDSLEVADSIIALLSPNYIESPQHVEEFHMGLWRQRVSPEEAPLLVPVQVAVLPKQPTYFQLVGYPVNTWDRLWADLLGVQNIRSPKEIDQIWHKVGKRLPEKKISPDEIHPMSEVAEVVMMSIKAKRTIKVEDPPRVRPALVNTVKLQKELALLSGSTAASLDQCLVDVPLPPGGASDSKSCIIM